MRRNIRYPLLGGFICGIIFCGSSSAGSIDDFNHHIHNFSPNHLNERNNRDYALAQKHALAMGYTMVTIGKPDEVKYDKLGVIKLQNAYYAPMRFNMIQKKVWYFDYYSNQSKSSLVRPDRNVWSWQSWDNQDFKLLKSYGCAKSEQYDSISSIDTVDNFREVYWTNWQNGGQINVVANFQSRWVVDQLIKKTLASLYAGNFDALFFDDLARDTQDCANKYAGGSGAYATWKDGQKDFIKRLTDWLRGRYTYKGKPYRIFGNIWSPKSSLVKSTILKWYADHSLRLDHYYYEAGSYGGESLIADGLDPETGLPAYTAKYGYLPANAVSLSTTHGWYGPSIGAGTDTHYRGTAADFRDEHLDVTGIAGLQGSWFGWYGESNVDRRDPNRRLVFTNELQLLRAIPNWDNLVGLPLNTRSYDCALKQYRSTNSFASREVIYSRHFSTGELYAVFLKPGSEVTLRAGEKIAGAYFANDAFGKSSENALRCIGQYNLKIRLTCPDKLGRGIRILLQ